jgi:hypothetical protein
MERPITESERNALTILANEGRGCTPKEFAKRMWPDSPGWQRHSKCGYGSHRGGGMYQTAGAYLAKLRKLKLVERGWDDSRYFLTRAGRQALFALRVTVP